MKKFIVIISLLLAFSVNAQTQINTKDIKDGAVINSKVGASAAIAWSKINKTGAIPTDVGAESPLTFSEPLHRSGNTVTLAGLTSGILQVASGGTGANTFTAGRLLIGNDTSAIQTSGKLVWSDPTLTVTGSLITSGFSTEVFQVRRTPNPTAGYVMTTDANGYGNWVAPNQYGAFGIAEGSVLFAGGAGNIAGNSTDFSWNNSNKSLTITGKFSSSNIYEDANYNLAVGTQSLSRVNPGSGNVAFGYQSLINLTTGNYNTAVGMYSQLNATTARYNTSVGLNSLENLTTGQENVAIGDSAGIWHRSGNENVFIGYAAGGTNNNQTNNSSVWIGSHAGPVSSTGLTNAIAIGYYATNTASNQVVLGNSSITDVYAGDTTALAKVHAAGFVGPINDLTSTADRVVIVDGTGKLTVTSNLQFNHTTNDVTSTGIITAVNFTYTDGGIPPTCDVTQRGRTFFKFGGGGSADTFQACGKNAAGVYAWTDIATFP